MHALPTPAPTGVELYPLDMSFQQRVRALADLEDEQRRVDGALARLAQSLAEADADANIQARTRAILESMAAQERQAAEHLARLRGGGVPAARESRRMFFARMQDEYSDPNSPAANPTARFLLNLAVNFEQLLQMTVFLTDIEPVGYWDVVPGQEVLVVNRIREYLASRPPRTSAPVELLPANQLTVQTAQELVGALQILGSRVAAFIRNEGAV